MRKKYLIPLSLALVVLGGCAKEIQQDPFERYTYSADEEKTEWKVEAGGASLSIDPNTTRLTYTDKNGTVWYSIPEEDPGKVTGYNDEEVNSNLVIEYSNDVGNTRIYGSYKYSVDRGFYEIEQVDGDVPGFDIHYTIGNIKRQYKFPQIMTDTEYEAWKEKFNEIDKSYFKKYIRENYDEYSFDDLPDSFGE